MRRVSQSPALFPYTTLFRSAAVTFERPPSLSKHALTSSSFVMPSPLFPPSRLRADGSPHVTGCRLERGTCLGCALRSEEHTSELQSRGHLVCRLLLAKQKHH